MPWFKVDDQLAMHIKTIQAGNAAIGVWVRAGAWASANLTDGFVPVSMQSVLGASDADIEALVRVGFWHEVEGGWQFHDWGEYQPTAESVRRERQAAKERMRAVRARNKDGTTARSGDVRANRQRTGSERSSEVQAKFGDPVPVPVPEPVIDDSPVIEVTTDRAREISDQVKNMLAMIGVEWSAWVGVLAQHGITLRTDRDYVQLAQHLLGKTTQAVENPTGYVVACVRRNPLEVRTWATDTDSLGGAA
ncbi:hypothetical protein [Gulosibacter hominis]|uniref:hypothetical protein n=1 Tax=Gulosibacter hominis TaxID=2770504 RepID=UPI00191907AA|nr:hypothetical protein [Gulosibacter hominis]